MFLFPRVRVEVETQHLIHRGVATAQAPAAENVHGVAACGSRLEGCSCTTVDEQTNPSTAAVCPALAWGMQPDVFTLSHTHFSVTGRGNEQ